MTPPFGISSAFPNQYRVNTSYIFVTLNPNFKLSACIPPFPNGGNFMGFSNASRIATVVKRSSPITTGYIGIATHWHALNNVFMGSYMTDFASLIQSAKSGVVWTALKAPAQLSQVQAVFEVDMQIYKSTVQPNPNKLTFIAIGDQTFQLLRNFSCSTPFRASLFPGASIYKVSHFSQGHIHTMFSQLAALAGIPLTGAPASRIGKLTNFSSSNLQSCLWGK